jgi:hypothetical protein
MINPLDKPDQRLSQSIGHIGDLLQDKKSDYDCDSSRNISPEKQPMRVQTALSQEVMPVVTSCYLPEL